MSLGSILTVLAASYDVAPAPTTIVVSIKASKPRATVKSVSDGSQKAPSDNTPPPMVMVLPNKGTLDAESFMIAMRNAGKRKTAEGKPIFDPREVRNDQIVAIAGFVGYDNRQSFASQELQAMMMAKRSLSKQPIGQQTEPYNRNATSSLRGYVAGMPDDKKRRLADLRGREVGAVEAREDYIRKSRDASLSPEQRKEAAAYAAIEHRRIDAIRKDIATF